MSQLIDLREYSFSHCSALKCLYLPASVERVVSSCFCGGSDFARLGFEPCSNLNFIDSDAFSFCPQLKSIMIPATVSNPSSQAFLCSGIERISMEEGNEHYKIACDCIAGFN
jgi:hypothetical protein